MKQILTEDQVNHLIELGLDTKYLRSIPCLDSEITALSGKITQTLLLNDLLDIINSSIKITYIRISHVKNEEWCIACYSSISNEGYSICGEELIDVLYDLVCNFLEDV